MQSTCKKQEVTPMNRLMNGIKSHQVTAFFLLASTSQSGSKYSRPPEIVALASQDIGANVKPLTSGAWAALLEVAGLAEIMVRAYTIRTQDEARGIQRHYAWGGMAGVIGRMLLLPTRSPAYRKFVKEVRAGAVMPENLEGYFGYGLFVGQK